MSYKIGIDVGGTFTDFFLTGDGIAPMIHKVLSTPDDPSIAVIRGLEDLAGMLPRPRTLADFAADIEVIVHGTTVTTNATLTRSGARTALLTTSGVRDALEMRRGIREKQYDNHYTNVTPLVPRYLRIGVGGRLDRNGRELAPLDIAAVERAIEHFRKEAVEAVAICFMNAFANPEHERRAAEIVRERLPDAYLAVSTDLLPSIRFYERVSTIALNAYVGPILDRYLDHLQNRLGKAGFAGLLLVMQSNGGVMTPQVAREKPALTLLSGPAGGPGAGLFHVGAYDENKCIVVDMGGTSFEASLVHDEPVMVNDGEIDRLRIALPMLGIHTIGAGGGSIGWIDEGGLLRMGPQSAGADPGPACYGRGGNLPTTTDADLVLGYLDPDFFAGGRMRLDIEAARAAIDTHIARPLGLTVEEAAAGMYRIACTNMAQGIREITISRGSDPREFPLVVAGGAGPIHSCLICDELDIPLQIVPRESSVLCAVGMLMSDLKHDYVQTFVARFDSLDWDALEGLLAELRAAGDRLLEEERIPPEHRRHDVRFDCRYLKQYHEVSFDVPAAALARRDLDAIAAAFHAEHNRLYGYSLEEEGAPIEIINVRVRAIGLTGKPALHREPFTSADASPAARGERPVYVFEAGEYRTVPVFDGHGLRAGNRIQGPALIESVTTAVYVSAGFDCLVDAHGSLALYRKGRQELVAAALAGETA